MPEWLKIVDLVRKNSVFSDKQIDNQKFQYREIVTKKNPVTLDNRISFGLTCWGANIFRGKKGGVFFF